MDNFKELMNYIVNNESKKTVGTVLKRIEIFVDQAKKEGRDTLTFQEIELMKANIRELLYEEFRTLKAFMETGKIVWEFKKSEDTNGK